MDPQRPGEVARVRVEPDEAVLVAQLFDWYLEAGVTLYRLAKRLTDLGIATPTGKPRWNVASVRGILRNPAYTGRAQTNRTRVAPARQRKAALLPVGPGQSHAPRPPEEWVTVAVPQIVSEETFAQVQAKLDANQQGAARNTRHPYLLRALVSCGACRLSCTARTTQNGYNYYICVGRTDALRRAQGQRCTARYAPAAQLDELVWADLSALLTDPAQVAAALARARGGEWLPQELHARQRTIGQAIAQLERQQQRLLDAYLAEVVALGEFERKRGELERRRATLADQQHQLDAIAQQRLELGAVADGIERFCRTVRDGLATATFTQRRLLVELLIDRVVVTDGEIRYALPTAPEGPHPRFCQLRKDHLRYVTERHPIDPSSLSWVLSPAAAVMHRNHTALLPAYLRQRYEIDGLSHAEVAAETGVARSVVQAHAKRAGIRSRPVGSRVKVEVDVAWFAREYVENQRTLFELAMEAGTSPTTLSRIAKAAGIPLRARGGSRPRRRAKVSVDLGWFAREYFENKRTLAELAAQAGTAPSTLSRIANAAGIPLRPSSTSRSRAPDQQGGSAISRSRTFGLGPAPVGSHGWRRGRLSQREQVQARRISRPHTIAA